MYGHLFLALGLGWFGCSRDAGQEAIDSDANGYLCRKCEHRFLVEAKIFAERCPSCRAAEISPVVGFVCSRDQAVTLVGRGPGSVPCGKCGEVVTSTRLPRSTDLKQWGAKVAAPNDVMMNSKP